MVEFRLAMEYGRRDEYMVEVWDGGRIVAVIHPAPYGLMITGRMRMHVDVDDDGKTIHVMLARVVE
ncbi:MAG: hypothetical protein RMJ59_00545 [Candidatus Nitrosocaldus sp.]|nr:hypothetical protein [Candidatus Nitrosocaldus sp.]MCS7140859.1 hypothetical protein [Candidatus Nitrosocaldus sp.]MDW7999787.1 hypothetical protein [Candidatus Nitrosocaldus sp.]MDW8274852.1 hypothetical protein [Candidatus Nitrosocaldus sp.]